MLKTKTKIKILDNKFIDIDKRSSLTDLNILRILEYINAKENRKFNTFKKSYSYKLKQLFNLKTDLNLKKQMYIKGLRAELKTTTENDFKLNENAFKYETDFKRIKTELINLKLIKDNIGYYNLLNFYNSITDKRIFYKLKNINADIKHIETIIKNFKDYYKQITPNQLKINSYDLNQARTKNLLTHNAQETLYFYLINLKKVRNQKLRYNQNLKDKLNFKCLTKQDIKNLIDLNLKQNFKTTLQNLKGFDITLFNNILNKYI